MHTTTLLTLLAALGLGSGTALLGSLSSHDGHDGHAHDKHQAPPRILHGEPGDLGGPGAGGAVSMTSRLSQTHLVPGASDELFLCLYVDGHEPEARPERLGLNLALVIDRSGSMASRGKLEYAKQAAEQLIARLGPKDSLSILAYDDEVQRVVASPSVLDHGMLRDAVAPLVPGGSTNLHGGLVEGFDEVRRSIAGERLNRVILLSDGLATAGITEPGRIAAAAAGFRQHGVRVSTMGLGVEYDERLMQAIAQRSGGNYYYVAQPEQVGDYLDAELDELGSVVAKAATIDVKLGAGVEALEVYGHEFERYLDPSRATPGGLAPVTVRIPIEDVRAGEQRRVLLRLRVAPGTKAERAVGQASLHYQLAATGVPGAVGEPCLGVRYTQDHEVALRSRDLAVLSKVEVVRNAEALLAAMDLREAGRIEEARAHLGARIDASFALNEAELHSDEVDRILGKLDRVRGELERTASSREAGRDLDYRTSLEALGYM
ncbi:MAG: VWA domain-containing protein [Planctomycetota bacterium]|nr:VWA domain-containing protein [Planctomycetota bacterium]